MTPLKQLGGLALMSIVPILSVAQPEHRTSVEPELESIYHQVDGINYYLEKRGDGPYLVMVTSGQGDSGAYRFLAENLAEDYTVITFDPPGFSRSSPPPAWEPMSSESLGDQVAALVRSLGIERAVYYGSSSGGTTVLSLIADHPELVKSAVIHEPAVVAEIAGFQTIFPLMMKLKSYFGGGFAEEERENLSGDGESFMISDRNRYRQLGADHIERRIRNKEIWYENYARPNVPCCNRRFTAEELKQTPIVITAGEKSSDSLVGRWFNGGIRRIAERAGAGYVIVPGKHFTYVVHPEATAEIIRALDANQSKGARAPG